MPVGTTHVYPVAPATGAIEYVAVPNPHKPVAGPDIVPGGGSNLLTAKYLTALVVHPLVADTPTFPDTGVVKVITIAVVF